MKLIINANSIYDHIIRIGRQTENLVSEVTFNLNMWVEEYGAGECVLNVRRNGDGSAYPVPMTIVDGMTTWTITDTDTARKGRGEIQLVYHAGDKVKTSPIFTISCGESLVSNGEPPSGYEDWLTELGEMTAQVEAAKTSSEASAQSASASAQRAETASRLIPTVTVEQTSTGAEITVTDSTGQTTTATLANGRDGQNGVDGKDGSDADIIRFLPVDSANGVIASFPDGADDIPLKSIVIDIDPVQDLHGYDNPWPAGGSYNLLPQTSAEDETINGIRFQSDGKEFHISGTASATAQKTFDIAEVTMPSADIYVHLMNDVANSSISFFFCINGQVVGGITLGAVTRIYKLSALTGATFNQVKIVVASGQTIDITFSPMLCLDDTVKPFLPYSNICPIAGWTGCEVRHSGANTTNPDVISISWESEAGTVYGGSLDVTNGVLTVDRKFEPLNNLTSYSGGAPIWFYSSNDNNFSTNKVIVPTGTAGVGSGILSSCYASRAYGRNNSYATETSVIWAHISGTLRVRDTRFTDVNSWLADVGAQTICYPLATPIIYQLTPTEVKSLLGQNNIWADTGDTTVEYRADISAYIAKKIAEAISALS